LDKKKAESIINSRDNIEVLYQGSPVWIQSINGEMARVKFMNTDSVSDIPVSDLIFGGAK
jgi:small acid-soluble spore protein H (minor)